MDFKLLITSNSEKKKDLLEKLKKYKDLKTQKLNAQIKINKSLAVLESKIREIEDEINNADIEFLKDALKNSNININDPEVLETMFTVGEEKTSNNSKSNEESVEKVKEEKKEEIEKPKSKLDELMRG